MSHTDDGVPVIGNIAEDTRPEGHDVALIFACYEGDLTGGIGWDLPFAEGRYNEAYKMNLGRDLESGVAETRTGQWNVTSTDAELLLTVFGNPYAVLLELLGWGVVGFEVFDVQGGYIAGAYFELEGMGDAIKASRPLWDC